MRKSILAFLACVSFSAFGAEMPPREIPDWVHSFATQINGAHIARCPEAILEWNSECMQMFEELTLTHGYTTSTLNLYMSKEEFANVLLLLGVLDPMNPYEKGPNLPAEFHMSPGDIEKYNSMGMGNIRRASVGLIEPQTFEDTGSFWLKKD